MRSTSCAPLNGFFRLAGDSNVYMIGVGEAVSWLQHDSLSMPKEFEVRLLRKRILHQSGFDIAAHEQELDVDLWIREQCPKKQPLAFDVKQTVRIVGEFDETVRPQREEARIVPGNSRGSRHEEKEIDVATCSMRIVSRDLAPRLRTEVAHDERGTTWHFSFDCGCGAFDSPHQPWQTVIDGSVRAKTRVAGAAHGQLRRVRQDAIVRDPNGALETRRERSGRAHAANG